MQISVQPNGALRISLDSAEARKELESLLEAHCENDLAILNAVMDAHFTPNGKLYAIRPEDVGALTDAPMVTDDLDVSDDGIVTVKGSVWWYPVYERFNFARKLLTAGFVDFDKAPDTCSS